MVPIDDTSKWVCPKHRARRKLNAITKNDTLMPLQELFNDKDYFLPVDSKVQSPFVAVGSFSVHKSCMKCDGEVAMSIIL